MALNKVTEDNNYLFIESTQDSEELKEEPNNEQELEMKFERFDFPFIKWFWPTI